MDQSQHCSVAMPRPPAESKEELDFKDTGLKMLVVSLKEMTATKEVILTLEQLLCDDTSQLEEERNQVTRNKDTFQDLVRLMDQHRVDRATQLSILRSVRRAEGGDGRGLGPCRGGDAAMQTCVAGVSWCAGCSSAMVLIIIMQV